MSNRIKNNLKNLVGQTLNQYYSKVKPTISDLRYKQEYQNRIIECMVGEVDDNYITTPETDSAIVKLEHSKEGLVKVPSIKGKTILVDADGNETDTPAEGCRLVSVSEEEDNKLIILSKNKNLVQKVIIGDILNEDGSFKTSNSDKTVRSETHISVKSNTNYIISNDLNYSNYIYEYDINKNLITLHKIKRNPYTFTTSNSTHYITFRSTADEIQNDINVKYQLEEGTQATSYIEPKHYKTEILLDEPLKSLSDSVKDDINKNKINRRLKYIVLNGSEKEWEDWDEQSFVLRGEYFSDAKYNTNGHIQNARSNIYTWGAGNIDMTFRYYRSETVLWSMFTKPNGITTLSDFKQWLSENPIMIIYELAEPIIEELPNGITLQGYDDTTMYVENSVTPVISYGYNALIPYKEELLNQKEEVETNTLDIEQNIIPYLMDMEFNLMLMEDNE